MKEKWVLLGASRGLGRSFLSKAVDHAELFCLSRKVETLPVSVQTLSVDFSNEGQWEQILSEIRRFQPQRIFYFAGGGPYGKFQDKQWKDHRWALKVSFEFPAFLLHQYLCKSESLKQFTVIGSSVAEGNPDPQASAYCAAKHALKGLIESILKEQTPALDLRLFSPGYMDTALLPANAWPRQQSGLVRSPEEVAEMLWASIHKDDDANKHFVLKSFP
jgi:short-subunit dehydrogenase